MRKVIFFVAAMFVAMAVYSQTAGRVPFEVKRSVFFGDGSLDEYTTSEWDSAFTHINKEVRYSASGVMVEQVIINYNEDKGWLTSRITTDPHTNTRKGTVEYKYDQRSNLLIREQLNNAKNIPLSFNDYTYDERGNRKSRTIKNRAGDELAETVYTYDSASKLTKSETKDQTKSTISSTVYSYDSQGNKLKEEVVNGEGRLTSITTFVWQEGREVKSETTTPDGRVLLRILNEYGGSGQLDRKTIENLQGESKQVLQYEYTYRPVRR